MERTQFGLVVHDSIRGWRPKKIPNARERRGALAMISHEPIGALEEPFQA
jgi:hypothetical protein